MNATGGTQGTKANSCKGCLFFSKKLKENERNPVCFGIPKTETIPGGTPLQRATSDREVEQRPLTDFKYACIGYSIYRDTLPSNASAEPDTASALPLCQGIEILADRRVEGKQPAVSSKERTTTDSRDPVEPPALETPPSRPQSGPFRPLGGISGLSQDEFAARFIRTAGLISRRCYTDMLRTGKAAKESISGIFHSDRGRPK